MHFLLPEEKAFFHGNRLCYEVRDPIRVGDYRFVGRIFTKIRKLHEHLICSVVKKVFLSVLVFVHNTNYLVTDLILFP